MNRKNLTTFLGEKYGLNDDAVWDYLQDVILLADNRNKLINLTFGDTDDNEEEQYLGKSRESEGVVRGIDRWQAMLQVRYYAHNETKKMNEALQDDLLGDFMATVLPGASQTNRPMVLPCLSDLLGVNVIVPPLFIYPKRKTISIYDYCMIEDARKRQDAFQTFEWIGQSIHVIAFILRCMYPDWIIDGGIVLMTEENFGFVNLGSHWNNDNSTAGLELDGPWELIPLINASKKRDKNGFIFDDVLKSLPSIKGLLKRISEPRPFVIDDLEVITKLLLPKDDPASKRTNAGRTSKVKAIPDEPKHQTRKVAPTQITSKIIDKPIKPITSNASTFSLASAFGQTQSTIFGKSGKSAQVVEKTSKKSDDDDEKESDEKVTKKSKDHEEGKAVTKITASMLSKKSGPSSSSSGSSDADPVKDPVRTKGSLITKSSLIAKGSLMMKPTDKKSASTFLLDAFSDTSKSVFVKRAI